MKVFSVEEAQSRPGQIMAEACDGEVVVLTDGANRLILSPHELDVDEDGPELEAELLKAAQGPFKPYSPEEMRAACDQALREERGGRRIPKT